MENTAKKKIFSGIQPTGIMTLGNYLGAVKNWVELQEEYDTTYCIVDMHAITVRQDPKDLRRNTLEAYALLLACGIDPKKSTAFIQSHVRTHAELAWVLNCYTQFGELSRMTQFKDKSAKHADNINAGLFAYPSLMAADILLYNANFVPIGADQKQHLELTRDIANRFNGLYGDVFTIPEAYIPKHGARIMSLQEPLKKMSKSDENTNAFICILDEPDAIIKKFKRAITDSEAEIVYRDGKDGINNLLTIYSVITGKTITESEKEFDGKGYGVFKSAVGEAVANSLEKVRTNFKMLMHDQGYLEKTYKEGAEKALKNSSVVLKEVYKRIGFVV